jgi:hypothetical protein
MFIPIKCQVHITMSFTLDPVQVWVLSGDGQISIYAQPPIIFRKNVKIEDSD